MSDSSDALETFIATTATYQYIVVAGCAWVVYDWLITLGQEIDLVWRQRSKAWKSKFLYAVIRYPGLALVTYNVIVNMGTDWSARFCHAYFYITIVIGTAHMGAAQGALLLKLYVMYNRSFTVMAISITFFVVQVVSMVTLWFVDVEHVVPALPMPAPATGCQVLGQHQALPKVYWFIALLYETFTCGLVLWSSYSHRKVSGMSRPNILTVLIRDSLVWYVCLGVFLFLNALGSTTGTWELTLIGVPAVQCTGTVGGSRFLLNLRAAYFGPTQNTTLSRLPRGTDFTQTEGTVGVFRSYASDLEEGGEEEERDCEGSTEMGLWTNDGPGTLVIMLQPVPASQRRQRACSTQGSSSSNLREPGDGDGPGVSALDLSHPVHSSTRLCG